MHAPLSGRLAAALAIVMLVACDRSLTRDVTTDAKLTSRVQEIVRPGSDSAAARRVLVVQGFKCGAVGVGVSDSLDRGAESSPRLTCEKIDKRARGKRFEVSVILEGATVRGVEGHVLRTR